MKKSFVQKHPYMAAILMGLLCTFLTGLGMAIPQMIGLNDNLTYIVATVSLFFSIAVGIFIMKKSRFLLSEYGFRTSERKNSYKVWWYIPLIIMEVLPLLVFGFSTENTVTTYIIFAFFTLAVGVNEEIYFRGLILKFLEMKGSKKAIIWSSVIFGTLHLINALNGKDVLYLILQMLFAFLVGFVLAEIVSITKSLWVVIIWHGAHDFISFTTSEALDLSGLIVLAVQVAILLIFAIGIWKSSVKQEKVVTETFQREVAEC